MKAKKLPTEIDYFPFERKYHANIMEWSTPERPISITTPKYLQGISKMEITTLEGVMKATENEDIIIKGVKGEVYPCKKDIFFATYVTL